MSSGIHLLAVKRTFVFGKKDIINWYLDWLVVWSRIGPITCYRCHAIVTHRHKIFIENIPHLQGDPQNRTRVSMHLHIHFFGRLDIIFSPFLVAFKCTWDWAWPSKIFLCSACLWRHKIRDRESESVPLITPIEEHLCVVFWAFSLSFLLLITQV